MKAHRLLVLSAVLGGLAVAGCKQQSTSSPAKFNSEEAAVALTNAALTLPAVKGNPGAAYFTLSNRTKEPVTLTGVEIEGAERTEMHDARNGAMVPVERIDIPAGAQLAFAPLGYHAMVFGVPATLTVGSKAKITVKFEGGRQLSAQGEVKGPGMAGMDHGAMH